MIELENVSVSFCGGVTALHPTSLRFGRSEFTVLLGASGAGKSTLLRCLNYLNRPSGGTVRVEGIGELANDRAVREHRRRTGMIFQQHQLIERHSALANVLLGRIGYHASWRTLFPLSRAERRIAIECLDRVGLLDKALERVDRLSGGQQQRVGIARALSQQPRLMLADEPVASLDPVTARRVLSQLRRIGEEDGITTVVSLHQVEFAREFADRVVALSHGRVVFDGAPAALNDALLTTIYEHPASVRGAETVAAAVAAPFYDYATLEE